MIAYSLLAFGSSGHSGATEAAAAGSFFIGSSLIAKFNPQKNPTLLFYGGASLAVGGAFLAVAAGPIVGVPLVVAYLETARGGLFEIKQHIESKRLQGLDVGQFTDFTAKVGGVLMAPYTSPVNALCNKFPKIGKVAVEHPHLLGGAIKTPGRIHYIGQKAAQGDAIGVAIGSSWYLLGDVGLLFFDEKFRCYVANGCGLDVDSKSLPAVNL